LEYIMHIVNINEAKTSLSKLIEEISKGKEYDMREGKYV